MLTCSVDSAHRSLLTVSPATEKTRSLAADAAGIAKCNLANRLNVLNLQLFCSTIQEDTHSELRAFLVEIDVVQLQWCRQLLNVIALYHQCLETGRLVQNLHQVWMMDSNNRDHLPITYLALAPSLFQLLPLQQPYWLMKKLLPYAALHHHGYMPKRTAAGLVSLTSV